MPPHGSYEFTRMLIKYAKYASNEGDHARATALLMQAIGTTHDCGELTDAARLAPHIRHRQAMAIKHIEGGTTAAEKYFDLANSLFWSTIDDPIGQAITLRDWGYLCYTGGDKDRGITLIGRAQEVLADAPKSERRGRERLVTLGFQARTAFLRPSRALDTLIAVREELEGDNKLIYQLDNERALLPRFIQQGHRRDAAKCRVRAFALYREIVIRNHGLNVADQIMEGHFSDAVREGATGVYRLLPHSLRLSN